jgi:chaperonin GroEL (HSP60 family)
VQARGWGGKSDHEVLRLAEADAYEVFVTIDKNIVHQQNTTALKIKIYPLSTPSWPRLRKQTASIVEAVLSLRPLRENLGNDNVDE